MSQKLLDNRGSKNTFQFNKDFIKSYDKESDGGYFLNLMFNIPKIYKTFTMIYSFYLKDWGLKKTKNL